MSLSVVRGYEQKGNLNKALIELDKSLDDPLSIVLKSDILHFMGDPDTAYSLINQIEIKDFADINSTIAYRVTKVGILLSRNSIREGNELLKNTNSMIENSKLIEKNSYWMGRLYRVEGDYLNSVLAYNKSMSYFVKSRKVFEKLKNKIEISRSIHKIGSVLENQGDLEKALKHYIQSLEISTKLQNKYDMAHSLNRVGVVYAKISDLTKGLEFLEQAKKYSDEIDFKLESAIISVNLGNIYKLKGNLYAAEKEYLHALIVFKDLNDKEKVARTYINLGLIQYNNGDLIKAIDTCEMALPLVEKYSNKKEKSFLLNNMGIIYKKLGNYSSSLKFYKMSLALTEEIGDKRTIASALLNIGIVYLHKGELNQAKLNFEYSLDMNKDLKNITDQATAKQYLGLIYLEKGDHQTSIEFLSECLELRKELDNEILVSETLYYLILAEMDSEKLESASKHFSELTNIDKKSKNKIVRTRKRLAEAIILQNDTRINKKVEAQELFEAVLAENTVDNELTIFAMLKLCEFLLLELKVSGEKEVLVEIKTLLEKLYEMAQNQESHPLLIEILIIQSQLALVEYNVKETKEFLEHANEIAEDKELTQYKLKISYLLDQVEKDVIKFANIASSVPINDRINQLQIESYLKEVADHKDLNSFDPEIFKTGLKKNLQMHLNFANLLLMDKTLPEEMKKYVHFIDLSVKEIQFSISTLLMIEKLEAGTYYQNLEDFNCDEIIQFRINQYEEKLNEKSLVVDFQKTNGITTVRSDQYLFSRIMDHLLDNGIKFADEKSTIKIILETDENSRTITIENECEAIPEHEQSNLFDKYTQYLVHESTRKHGVGLGLAFCDLALKSIKGKVSLVSPKPNKDSGVTVTITIPKEI